MLNSGLQDNKSDVTVSTMTSYTVYGLAPLVLIAVFKCLFVYLLIKSTVFADMTNMLQLDCRYFVSSCSTLQAKQQTSDLLV